MSNKRPRTEPNQHLPARNVNMTDRPAQGMTDKQLESLRDSTAMVNIWEGAVSSGKTVASIYRFLLFLGVAGQKGLPGEVVISGRTREAVWRNVLLPAMQLYPGTVSGNMGAPTAMVMGRRCHVIGASDAKAESVLRGITALCIYLDEVTTLPEGYFKMALTRLRVTGRSGGVASKLFGSTNPDNPMHWLKAEYLDKIGEDPEITRTWRRFHFTLDDNPTLSPEYVRAMKAQYTGLFYKRFILGEWVMGEGTIWDTFDPDRHVVDISDVPRMERVVALGVDFGSTHKSAGVLLGVADQRLWVLREWAPATGLAPSIQSAGLQEWLKKGPPGWAEPEFIFVDSAAKAFRDQLFHEGMPTAPAWKHVQGGLQLVHSLISLDRVRVVDTCTNLIKEIPSYVWDADAADRGVDEPVKVNDDFCDAFRYGVYSSQSQWQGLIPIIVPTPQLEVAA